MKRALREYFGGYGTIKNVNMKIDLTTGRSRGFVLVFFRMPRLFRKLSPSLNILLVVVVSILNRQKPELENYL